jgi:glutathione S-transferase
MFHLYHADRSTCSQKVRLCLAELGLEYVSRRIDLVAGDQLTPEYLAINPNGVVPTLVHNGVAIAESTVICEYLCEITDDRTILPANALGRAQMRAWLRYIDEVPSMAVRVPSFNNVFLPFYRSMSQADFKAFVEAMPIRKYFFEKMGQGGFSGKEYENALEQLRRSFVRVEKSLSSQQWIAGSHYTLADICMVPVMQRLDDIGLVSLWAEFPRLTNWYEAVRGRRAYTKAFYPGSHLGKADQDIIFGRESS